MNTLFTQLRKQARICLNWLIAGMTMLRFGFPQRGMRLVGVTGTDGKTTTVQMIAAILRRDGRKVGLISTVGASIDGNQVDLSAHVSTPGPWQIYQFLSIMRKAGVKDVVVELTSHGLDQRRTAGLRFDVGVITNISPEHLDYHKTFGNYVAAKARLMSLSKVVVMNHDCEPVRMLGDGRKSAVWFGMNGGEVSARDVKQSDGGCEFELRFGGQKRKVKLLIPGEYNVMNALAAIAASTQLGVDPKVAVEALAIFGGVTGRWQVLQKSPFWVVVDFGHTPQAFEQILPMSRALVQNNGKLIHVFGCAGFRDAEKRQVMGKLSGDLADVSVITMEDPRTESLDKIQHQIIEGLSRAGKKEGQGWRRVDDRRQAIAWAIEHAASGDVVLLTGKGHEKSMNIGGKEMPWDEMKVVKDILMKRNVTGS